MKMCVFWWAKKINEFLWMSSSQNKKLHYPTKIWKVHIDIDLKSTQFKIVSYATILISPLCVKLNVMLSYYHCIK